MAEQIVVIATGGKQYLVKPGDEVVVERLDAAVGERRQFANLLGSGTVTASIAKHSRARKVSGRIFRNKVRASRFPHGHRQHQTVLKIETIK